MPRITLTDFVDVVGRSGSSKANKVAAIKHRPPYTPAFDFYKTIRETIEGCHRTGQPKSHLATILGTLSDPKKQTNYPAVVAGYTKWWGHKDLAWFEPPSDEFTYRGVDVVVNPELGLSFNGHAHIIKLYFKADPLTRHRVSVVTEAMEHSLRASAPAGAQMSVLDTRRARLISCGKTTAQSLAMLRAELAYIATLWPSV